MFGWIRVFGLSAALAAPVFLTAEPAQAQSGAAETSLTSAQARRQARREARQARREARRARREARAVPELDPTAASAAVAMVVGAGFIFWDRRRRAE